MKCLFSYVEVTILFIQTHSLVILEMTTSLCDSRNDGKYLHLVQEMNKNSNNDCRKCINLIFVGNAFTI